MTCSGMPFICITIVMALIMIGAWSWQYLSKRAEIVDICWTFGVGAAGIFCAIDGSGEVNRRVILASIVGVWSVRLGVHLIQDRLFALEEDGRYKDLRSSWNEHAQRNFFLFFQLQAALVVFLATSFYSVGANNATIGYLDYVAVVVFIVSIVGESVADMQLRKFRTNPQNRGNICSIGLWNYSRHPNYFFEWIHWLSYPLLAGSGRLFWLSLVSPLLMYYLIRNVTGVPVSEARMLEKRGEIFRTYQRSTSEFWLWFKKKEV